jgi:hypothetical protein
MKYSETSENAPSSYEQYQRQIDDWHSKFNARDADVKLLTRQVENLKSVIMTQGLTMPPPEPVSAPAPSNAPEELPVPGPGWHFGGANRAANRPNWGNVPPPEPILDNGWGICLHLLLKTTALTAIRIRVSNLNIEERASMLEEATATIPRESGIIISPSPPEKEDVILAKIMHAMCDKSRGI